LQNQQAIRGVTHTEQLDIPGGKKIKLYKYITERQKKRGGTLKARPSRSVRKKKGLRGIRREENKPKVLSD